MRGKLGNFKSLALTKVGLFKMKGAKCTCDFPAVHSAACEITRKTASEATTKPYSDSREASESFAKTKTQGENYTFTTQSGQTNIIILRLCNNS